MCFEGAVHAPVCYRDNLFFVSFELKWEKRVYTIQAKKVVVAEIDENQLNAIAPVVETHM